MKIIIILLAGYALLCWVSDRVIKQRTLSSPADEDEDNEILIDYDFYQIQQQLIQIQKTVERVKSIEDLITAMEITSPDKRAFPVTMEWADHATGQQHTFQFWADGTTSTQLMLETAYQERVQLRTSLSEQISALHDTVVTESVTETAVNEQERGVDAA